MQDPALGKWSQVLSHVVRRLDTVRGVGHDHAAAYRRVASRYPPVRQHGQVGKSPARRIPQNPRLALLLADRSDIVQSHERLVNARLHSEDGQFGGMQTPTQWPAAERMPMATRRATPLPERKYSALSHVIPRGGSFTPARVGDSCDPVWRRNTRQVALTRTPTNRIRLRSAHSNNSRCGVPLPGVYTFYPNPYRLPVCTRAGLDPDLQDILAHNDKLVRGLVEEWLHL